MERVRREGTRRLVGPLTVWALKTETRSRAALSVPARALGHVERNLVRRRLRAALDELLPGEGWDVIVAVRTAAPPSFQELREALGAAMTAALTARPSPRVQ